jgi:hypothetical protein
LLLLDHLEQHRLHRLHARDRAQHEVAVLARRLQDQGAAAEDPVQDASPERDVDDARQREVPAVARDDALADPHPPGCQLVGRRPPPQQREHQPPHQQDDRDGENH